MSYSPTLAEAALGVGGVAVALALVAIGARMFKVFPETLEDPEEA
jgi:molybdopterin-containing oxidoreductase family membrane subunit